jgi:hypothetical protein
VKVRFYLYFPRREDADEAGRRLREDGYDVAVDMGADDENWLALASADLGEEEFEPAEGRLQKLAGELGGEYDGHEREVPRDR